MTSWDDGSKEDLRIAKLLRSYQLPGIFFLQNIKLELEDDEIRELSKDFEIGGHTLSHPEDLKRLKGNQLKDEITLNKMWLEDIIKKEIDWFCYPGGRYNEDTIKVVEGAGFKYARTTLVGNTDFSEEVYRTHPTVHVKRHRDEYKGQNWLDYAIEQFNIAKVKKGCYHIWGHGWEIEKEDLWEELEQLFKYIQQNK